MPVALTLSIALSVSSCAGWGPQDVTIEISTEKRYQTFTGWEALSQTGEAHSPNQPRYRQKLIDLSVSELGINRLRLEVRSGAENRRDYFSDWQSGKISEEEFNRSRYYVLNDNQDPDVASEAGFHFSELDLNIESVIIPYKDRLKKEQQDLYVNLCFVDFGDDPPEDSLKLAKHPEEYAEFIVAVFRHMDRKYGFVPDALEVILEPDNDTDWTGEDIGRAVSAASRRLKEAGFEPEFIAPSAKDAGLVPALVDGISKTPGAFEVIDEISYHLYRGGTETNLLKIADIARRSGKRTSMLEFIAADHDDLYRDLVYGNASAWQQYTLTFPGGEDNGGHYFITFPEGPKESEVEWGKRTKLLKQYFNHIRPGAVRIEAHSENSNFRPVAFSGADSGVVLLVNADGFGRLTVSGLPAGRYAVCHVGFDGNSKDEASVTSGESGNLEVRVPFPGVLAVYNEQKFAPIAECGVN